jgi:hypothetical protein
MGVRFEWRFTLFLWLACGDAGDPEPDAEDDEVACPAPAEDGAADEMAGADTHATARDTAIANDLIGAFTFAGRSALRYRRPRSERSFHYRELGSRLKQGAARRDL